MARVRKRPPPRINGAFVYHPALADADVGPLLAEIAASGCDTIAISEVRQKLVGCDTGAGASYAWVSGMPTDLAVILNAAEANELDVYVGLTFSSGVCTSFHTQPNQAQDATDMASTVTTLLGTYGTHPALAGWYVIDEAALAYHRDATLLTQNYSYYNDAIDAIRAVDAVRPIMCAPYLGGAYNNWNGVVSTPAQVGAVAAALHAACGGDLIQCWQDSTGAGGDGGISVSSTRYTYTTLDYYAAIAAAIPKANFWTDNELYAYPSNFGAGGGYTPSPIAKIRKVLEHSASAAKRMSWLWQTHMTETPGGFVEAARMLASYKAVIGQTGSLLTPASYTWGTSLEAGFTDAGTKLTDAVVADAGDATASGRWVGFAAGNVVLTVDLGSPRIVNWVGLHCMEKASASVKIPTAIKVEHSPDNATWVNAGTTTRGLPAGDSEYVIANTARLSLRNRYLRITLTNASKSRLGKLEIVGS